MTHTIEPLSSGIQPLKSLVLESDEESPANITKALYTSCLLWFNRLYKSIDTLCALKMSS